jgi:branched-chain amino acid aminotransferase
MNTDFVYYVNGEFVPAATASIALNDLGIVRGYGVFDVLRTYGPVPFALRQHLERLQRSAAALELPLPWPLAQLAEIVHTTLARNGHPHDVTVRLVLTGGASANFLTPEDKPSLAVILAPVRPYPPEIYAAGGRLITVDYARFMPEVKSLNYITGILGQKRARAAGAVEALYRTPAGEVTECTTSNFFAFRGDQLLTPVAEVLPGVTRDVVLEIASDMFDVVLTPLRYAELGEFDEAFITSTTKEVMPIVGVDDIVIGAGRPGLRTQRLLEAFRHYVTTETFE